VHDAHRAHGRGDEGCTAAAHREAQRYGASTVASAIEREAALSQPGQSQG